LKTFLKTHGCKLVLAVLQASFLGGGYVYIEEFNAIRKQIQASERAVIYNVLKIQIIGENIEYSAKKAEAGFKKAEKACRRLF
jgi:hypothetical protein